MKNVLNINQKAIKDYDIDIDIIDCALLDHMKYHSCNFSKDSIIYEYERYYDFDHEIMSKELPILRLKKDAIYRRLKKLCEKGFLKQHPKNQERSQSFYALTAKNNLFNIYN